MRSGGVGYDAASTLYLTSCYLYYATWIRFGTDDSLLIQSNERLNKLIDDVRDRLADIEFYKVTQDSAGRSMRGPSGRVMHYREFCEALTDKGARSCFMTLADVFFRLHKQDPTKVERIAESLERLAHYLDSSAPSAKAD